MKDTKDLSGFTISELATIVIALRELCVDRFNHKGADAETIALLRSADALHDEIDSEFRTRIP